MAKSLNSNIPQPRDSLPPEFFLAFNDDAARLAARAIESWAQFRRASFSVGPYSKRKLAWRVSVPGSNGPEYLITLEPTGAYNGILAIDFRQMRNGHFKGRVNREQYYKRARASFDVSSTPDLENGFLSIKWHDVTAPGGLIHVLAILDWAADSIAE